MIRRLAAGIWKERGRVLTSGVGALLLWFLLGQKVETTEQITVGVRCISAEEDWPSGNGLFIRIPSGLALSDVQPRILDLEVKGTREELGRLDRSLKGTFEVPAGFLRNEERATREYVVKDEFHFGRLLSLPSVTIESLDKITLTLARRYVNNLTLSAANLTFTEPGMGQDVRVDFEPSMVRVSGPGEQARRIIENPELFKLASIDQVAFEAATRGKLRVPARLGLFEGHRGQLERMVAEDQPIKITITVTQRFRTVVFPDVEVVPLIPADAWPAGVNRERPLSLHPDAVLVTLQVPEECFSGGSSESDLLKQLNLFVDLLEMPFDTAAENLRVHFEGLPEGARVKIEPPLIDVIWNIPEPNVPEPKEESGK
ncbi:MAG: hypothetical protein V2A76_07895 [Planctomycetota bacterium]